MGRPVAIIGVGQTNHGRRMDVCYPDLVREAVVRVYEETGLNPDDIDGVVSGTMPSMMEGVALTHFYFADAMKAGGKPILKTETCGSTGVSIAHTAYYWISSGMADLILAVGHEKMNEGDSQATMTTVAEPFYQRYFIAGAPGVFSMQSQMWSVRYGLEEEKVRDAAAFISVTHHDSAFDNPYAHIKMQVTMEDVKTSRVITYPVRLLDVCPNSDGACAVLFASDKMVKKLGLDKVAWVKGVGYRGEEYYFGDSDKAVWQSAVEAARQAYDMAGIKDPRKELDVAEVYNPFTFQEMMFYECFGFCGLGEAPDLVLKGTFARNGELPCDPSGGTLCTNPIGATGLIRTAEAALQVMGKAGDHQIPGAKTALSHAMGGVDQFNGIMIVGSEL
ncbi:MAG TPA: thiolase domain-containing protein [Deltaproteobacteria bacterium]|nr:thiolase domain-containing protein [Deltaproteobacteria bacterium]